MLATGGRPTNLDNGMAMAYCFCSRCGWGYQWLTVFVVGADGDYLDIFSLVYHFSFLSPSLLDGWMTWDYTSISAEFHLYQEAGWVMDDCLQWKHFYD